MMHKLTFNVFNLPGMPMPIAMAACKTGATAPTATSSVAVPANDAGSIHKGKSEHWLTLIVT
jgi:hypothetical protein